jgi:hypothetical protein
MDQRKTLADLFGVGCDYQQRDIDPNLIEALDKLGETFGPLGVAIAAATRTEPEALQRALHETFTHQREVWDWLRCDRYYAGRGDDAGSWHVFDREYAPPPFVVPYVATLIDQGGYDAEDAARALAQHMNEKVMLAKVAQATIDNSNFQPAKPADES